MKGKLKLHDESKDVASLRKRLFEMGDLNFDSGSEIFDESLEDGVKFISIPIWYDHRWRCRPRIFSIYQHAAAGIYSKDYY